MLADKFSENVFSIFGSGGSFPFRTFSISKVILSNDVDKSSYLVYDLHHGNHSHETG